MSRGRIDTALASIGLTGGMTGRSIRSWLHAGPVFRLGHEVIVLPLTTSASISVRGPWQITPTGLPLSKNAGAKATAFGLVRSWSGLATPIFFPCREPAIGWFLPPSCFGTSSGPWLTATAGAKRGRCSDLVLVVEDLGHAGVLEDRADRVGDDPGDRQHDDLVDPLVLGDRHGVGDDDLGQGSVLQPVDRRA